MFEAFQGGGAFHRGGAFSRGGPFSRSVSSRWFDAPGFADLAAVADFNNDRYALTTVAVENVAAATAADLCVKRPATFAELFAFTCASSSARSYVDAGGTLRTDLATDQPRFDWTNGKRQLGLTNAATNLVLNSATGATQSVTVAATANTLSFTGTGSVTLSGVSTAGPLSGTGANNRVALTFTPTSGSLTLTISGDVRLLQLEAGGFATPYIPTGGSSVARALESARFSPVVEAVIARAACSAIVRAQRTPRGTGVFVGLGASSSMLRSNAGMTAAVIQNLDGSSALVSGTGASLATTSFAVASCFSAAGRSVVRNGGTLSTDAAAISTDRTTSYLGRNANNSNYGDGWYDLLAIAPSRVADARLTELAVPA